MKKLDKDHIFFENYAGTWDRDRKEDRQKLEYLLQLAGIQPGQYLLDAGCGTGILLPYLSDAVGEEGQVEGMDYSRQMLKRGQEKFGSLPNVVFTEGNLLKYSFSPHVYDGVICLNIYPHLYQHSREFFRTVFQALKQDGYFVIMHDMPRQQVNRIHSRADSSAAVLPPVDMMAASLISAGFSVYAAMDTEDYYFIKVVKKHDEPYIHETAGEDDEMLSMPASHGGHAAGEHHHHSHTQTKVVLNRLARVSGHLEAIRRMVEDGRDCSDILIQLAAVHSAIGSVSKVILKDHIDHCIVDAIRSHDTDAVEHLKKAISTLMK